MLKHFIHEWHYPFLEPISSSMQTEHLKKCLHAFFKCIYEKKFDANQNIWLLLRRFCIYMNKRAFVYQY